MMTIQAVELKISLSAQFERVDYLIKLPLINDCLTLNLNSDMKEAEDLSSLTAEQLAEKKKELTSIYIGLAIPMLLAFAALIYFSIKTKNYALIAVALGTSITLLPGFVNIGAINTELKKREQENHRDNLFGITHTPQVCAISGVVI
jgi:hypothetical protein